MPTDDAAAVGFGAVVGFLEPFGPPQPRRRQPRRTAKRVSDMAVVIAASVVWIPVCLAIAGLIRASDGGPALFRQERIGLDGRPFWMWKFRTMAGLGEATTMLGDSRITAVGRVLRRRRLDELPQLVNVFLGEMSLIGPRPEQPSLARVYADRLAHYELRHSVRPGVTGLAQIRAPYAGNLEETAIKLAYDLEYVKRWSLLLDAWIALQTVGVVLTGKGAR